MFGEWHAIDADRDRSTGEAIGIHGGSGTVWVYVVSIGVVACGIFVGEVEVNSKAERQAAAFEQHKEGATSDSHMQTSTRSLTC